MQATKDMSINSVEGISSQMTSFSKTIDKEFRPIYMAYRMQDWIDWAGSFSRPKL